MNPFFWLLVLLALVLIWFLFSFAFKGIGSFALKIFNDAMDEFDEETKENEKYES